MEYTGTAAGEILLFMDTKWWDDFHKEQDCEKAKHATTRIPIGKTGTNIQRGLGMARGGAVTVDKDTKKKSWDFQWTITHKERTFGWYLVAADCDTPLKESTKNIKKKKKKKRFNSAHRVSYKIDMLNQGMDHLSADERWLTEIYILTTVALIVRLVFHFYSSRAVGCTLEKW